MGNRPPWTIEIDDSVCIGSGLCVIYAGETFAHDANAHAIVVDAVGDTLERIRVAVDACPTSAITLRMADEEGA